MRTNDVRLSPHFRLYEFEDRDSNCIVVIHMYHVWQLEKLRSTIHEQTGQEHEIIVTCGTRAPETNQALGEELGWIENGGTVARDSQHLPKHGGVATDIKARNKATQVMIPTSQLAIYCRGLFDTVIARYGKHVHVDSRHSAWNTNPDVEKPEPHS